MWKQAPILSKTQLSGSEVSRAWCQGGKGVQVWVGPCCGPSGQNCVPTRARAHLAGEGRTVGEWG